MQLLKVTQRRMASAELLERADAFAITQPSMSFAIAVFGCLCSRGAASLLCAHVPRA